MEIEISSSYPALSPSNTRSDIWTFFQSLPKAYHRFLSSYNGGFVEEFQCNFLTGVPFRTENVDNPSKDDCVVEFFGIPTVRLDGEWPRDLLQIAADHGAEQFLPRGVIAIASCVESSLVCISLRENDYGQIYYWDWHWQYPWSKPFFEQRVKDVERRYPNADEILKDPAHPEFQPMVDEFNYATIVKLADDFDQWIQSCYGDEEEEAE